MSVAPAPGDVDDFDVPWEELMGGTDTAGAARWTPGRGVPRPTAHESTATRMPRRASDAEALGPLCRAAVRAAGADAGAVWLAHDRGRLLLHAEPVGVRDLLHPPEAPGAGPFPHAVRLPVVTRERVWGSFDLYRAGDPHWTVDQLAVATLFAEAAGSVMALQAERDGWERVWQAAQHTANHDPLTGLPNRGLLFDRLEHAIANGARHGRAVAVLFIDIDDFKAVNDRHGHAVGDTTLVEVARRLARTVRANDTLARLSGDEFVVVCEDLDVATGYLNRWLGLLSERILQELRRQPGPGEVGIDISVSIGAAVTTRECSPQSLTSQADQAMYAAKRSGGGRLVVSRPRPTVHRPAPPTSA